MLPELIKNNTDIQVEPKAKPLPPVVYEKRLHRVDVMEALSGNTQASYKIDLSLFAYWLLGFKDEHYLKEMGVDISAINQKHLIPLASDNTIIHLELAEVAEVFLKYEVTPGIVAAWVQDVGFRYKLSTIQRKLSALNWAFQALSLDVVSAYPIVKTNMKVLRKLQAQFKGSKVTREQIKAKGFTPPRLYKITKSGKKKPEKTQVTGKDFELKQATPFRLSHLQEVMGYLSYGEHKLGENRVARDKAIISLIWHGLFRRSEIADIRIENIEFRPEGMLIKLYDTKNHEEEVRAINFATNPVLCPVKLVQAWLEKRGNPVEGWLFVAVARMDTIKKNPNASLDGRDIMRILQSACTRVGLDINFSGHSPRAGGATEIYVQTQNGEKVQRTGGWKSDTWKKYVRAVDSENFSNSGMKGLT